MTLTDTNAQSVLEDLEPQEVLQHFATLASIPRGSGNEAGVAAWVVDFARGHGLTAEEDELHCVLVRKPGQHGLEEAPGLILHGHLDMVCEKEEGVEIDFATEPIRLIVDGDLITADGTSLGADNGIGVSYILALLASTEIAHPPIEAVLTAMEEKGKVGAGQFDTSRLTGTRMIDFNWITDREILAGCSGDITFTVDVPGEAEATPAGLTGLLVKARGLKGGHCEFDIHLERANALQVLARAHQAIAAAFDVRSAAPTGGAQNNAIPADAEQLFAVRAEDVDGVRRLLDDLTATLRAEYAIADPDLRLEAEEAATPERVFSTAAADRLAAVTRLIPHGVISWNLAVPGRVESSNNLGTVRPTEDGARLMATITAASTSRKHEVLDRVRSLAGAVGGGVVVEEFGLDAPEFPYRPDSPLLKTAVDTYLDVFGRRPDVEVSQCSLELGMFSANVPDLDVISIGTELHALHSPAESVNHRSVAAVWPYVQQVVSRLS